MKYAVFDRAKFHDIHFNFHNDWFRHSEVNSDGFADRQTAFRLQKPLWGGMVG
jgi:hypothetical protein